MRERKKGIGYYNPIGTGGAKTAMAGGMSQTQSQWKPLLDLEEMEFQSRKRITAPRLSRLFSNHLVYRWYELRSVERDAAAAVASLTFASVPAPRKKSERASETRYLFFLSTNFARLQPHVRWRWMVALIKEAGQFPVLSLPIRPHLYKVSA